MIRKGTIMKRLILLFLPFLFLLLVSFVNAQMITFTVTDPSDATDPDLNDDYTGLGDWVDKEGERTYCITSSNRRSTDITGVLPGSIKIEDLEKEE